MDHHLDRAQAGHQYPADQPRPAPPFFAGAGQTPQTDEVPKPADSLATTAGAGRAGDCGGVAAERAMRASVGLQTRANPIMDGLGTGALPHGDALCW